MEEKKKPTLLIVIVYFVLAFLVVLVIVSLTTISLNPDKKEWEKIPENERKEPTLENVLEYNRISEKFKIRPEDYFIPESIGVYVNDPQDQSPLYCGDPANPEGWIPVFSKLYDSSQKPFLMFGRSFEIRFLVSEFQSKGVVHSVAYLCRAESVDALYETIRETTDQFSRQFDLKTSDAVLAVLESPERFRTFVDESKHETQVWSNTKQVVSQQAFTIIGDYTGENFQGTLRVTVHLPEGEQPYAVFAWQEKKHTLFFYGSAYDRCALNPIKKGEYVYIDENKSVEYTSGRQTYPKNFALDY